MFSCCLSTLCIMLPIRNWQRGWWVCISDLTHTTFPGLLHTAALHFTDLNSSRETVDIGRDPGLSFYLRPAAVLRVNSVHAPFFNRLGPRGKKQTKASWGRIIDVCNTDCLRKWTLWYHEASMTDVPCECGHGPFLRIHNRVLDDVRWAGHVLWKVPLHPARRSAMFGQQTSGNEAVGWSNLSENDVLRQNMVTVGKMGKLWLMAVKKN